MKLSILILTIPNRKRMFDKLISELNNQFTDEKFVPFEDYEILIQSDTDKTIGEKRNEGFKNHTDVFVSNGPFLRRCRVCSGQ